MRTRGGRAERRRNPPNDKNITVYRGRGQEAGQDRSGDTVPLFPYGLVILVALLTLGGYPLLYWLLESRQLSPSLDCVLRGLVGTPDTVAVSFTSAPVDLSSQETGREIHVEL